MGLFLAVPMLLLQLLMMLSSLKKVAATTAQGLRESSLASHLRLHKVLSLGSKKDEREHVEWQWRLLWCLLSSTWSSTAGNTITLLSSNQPPIKKKKQFGIS